MTIRYWDHETNQWTTADSVWNGRELPADNSGWQQKEPLLGAGTLDPSSHVSQREARKMTGDKDAFRKNMSINRPRTVKS